MPIKPPTQATILGSLVLTLSACSPYHEKNSEAEKLFNKLCFVDNMPDGVNTKKWTKLKKMVEDGKVSRLQLSLEHPTLNLESPSGDSLQSRVEASVGKVYPVGYIARTQDSGVFVGHLTLLLDQLPEVKFQNYYFATKTKGFILLVPDFKLRSCFSEKGGAYLKYIGRQI